MAIGDSLFLADKPTLDTVKTSTDTLKADATTLKADTVTLKADTAILKADTAILKADTALIKIATAVGSTYGDNLVTQTTDAANLVASLTGKYELLGLLIKTAGNFTIQIDGATDRKTLFQGIAAPIQLLSLVGMGIKCATSMKIYSNASGNSAIYRLLP